MSLFLDFRRQENLDIYGDGKIFVPITEQIRSEPEKGLLLARNILDRTGVPVAATIDVAKDGIRVMVGVVLKEPNERLTIPAINDLLAGKCIPDKDCSISMWLPHVEAET